MVRDSPPLLPIISSTVRGNPETPLVQGQPETLLVRSAPQTPVVGSLPTTLPSSSSLSSSLPGWSSAAAFVPSQLLQCPDPDRALLAVQQYIPQTTIPPARPNLSFSLPIFDPDDVPATTPMLVIRAWEVLLADYPDQEVAQQLLGAIRHGVLLGYSGPLETSSRLSKRNLPMTEREKAHVRTEIIDRVRAGRLAVVPDPQKDQLVCSPIGVVPKPNSTKLRTIHHLSHPRKGDSVNSGITDEHAAIRYESLDNLFAFVRDNPGALLWKADLREAFRSIVLGSSQSRLLGFHFDDTFYKECTLSFGCRSSPVLFNAFAEILHWALDRIFLLFPRFSRPSHYLDDFFGATTSSADAYGPVWLFQTICNALGFVLSPEKVFWNQTTLNVLGIDVDSVAMTAKLSRSRQQKLIQACGKLLAGNRADLHEVQTIAGHLQFVCRVTPHGRAFMRRLYNAVKARYKSPFQRRRLGKDARRELEWWKATLHHWEGCTLKEPSPLLVMHIWTDACPRGIGAHAGSSLNPTHILVKDVSRRHRRKAIHFLEAVAVLEALRNFTTSLSPRTLVIIHVDNEIVRHGLRSGSCKDPLTQALLRAIYTCMAERDLVFHAERVSSAENALADALSRRNLATIQTQFPCAHSMLLSMQPRSSAAQSTSSASQHTLPEPLGARIVQLN